jgi:hypothetical protein
MKAQMFNEMGCPMVLVLIQTSSVTSVYGEQKDSSNINVSLWPAQHSKGLCKTSASFKIVPVVSPISAPQNKSIQGLPLKIHGE